MKNLNGVDLSSLEDEAVFIETLLNDGEEPLELDPWQRRFVRDSHSHICVVKSRQTGYSYAEAAKGLVRSHFRPNYEKFFISKSLEEAKRKITYVQGLYSTMPEAFRLRIVSQAKTIVQFEDSKGRISTLQALSAKEPRGPNGDVSIDEIAHFSNAEKVYESAEGLVIRGQGRQLSIGSSPLAKSGILYKVATNDGLKYGSFRRYRVPWWLSRALCTDIREAAKLAPALSTEERVTVFGRQPIQDAFVRLPLEVFVQEFECGFMDEVSTFMPYELIWSCREVDYSDDPTEAECKLAFRYQVYEHGTGAPPAEDFWKWVRKWSTGRIEIGMDVGRTKDLTAIVVTDEIAGVKEVRAIVTLSKTPFPLQESVIDGAMRIVRPYKARIDKQGIGMPLAESMEAKYPTVAEGTTMTNPLKAKMANNIKARFEKKRIRIPAWTPLENNIHSIRKETVNALTRYEADASDHHGDIYWALGLTDARPLEVTKAAAVSAEDYRSPDDQSEEEFEEEDRYGRIQL